MREAADPANRETGSGAERGGEASARVVENGRVAFGGETGTATATGDAEADGRVDMGARTTDRTAAGVIVLVEAAAARVGGSGSEDEEPSESELVDSALVKAGRLWCAPMGDAALVGLERDAA